MKLQRGGGVWIELQRKFWEGLDDVTKGGGFSIELQWRF